MTTKKGNKIKSKGEFFAYMVDWILFRAIPTITLFVITFTPNEVSQLTTTYGAILGATMFGGLAIATATLFLWTVNASGFLDWLHDLKRFYGTPAKSVVS